MMKYYPRTQRKETVISNPPELSLIQPVYLQTHVSACSAPGSLLVSSLPQVLLILLDVSSWLHRAQPGVYKNRQKLCYNKALKGAIQRTVYIRTLSGNCRTVQFIHPSMSLRFNYDAVREKMD